MRRLAFIVAASLFAGCSLLLHDDLDGLTGGDGGGAPLGEGGATSGGPGSSSGEGGVNGDGSSPFMVEDAGLTAGDLRLYYAQTTGELFTRTWSHTDLKWQPPVLVRKVGGMRVPWVVPTISRFGSELVATLAPGTSAATLNVASGAGLPIAFSKDGTVSNAHVQRRGVDVAHGSASGAGMVVYADASPIPKFRRQTTAGWTDEAPVTSAVGVGTVDWIRLVAHPTTDEMTLLYSDTAEHLYGVTWNGSAWDATPTVLDGQGIDIDDWLSFAGAYENLTGNLLVTWGRASSCDGPADPVYFTTKASGSSTFAQVMSTADGGLVASFGPVLAASEPGTNRIAISAMEYADCCKTSFCNDWNSLLWDGSWKPGRIKDLDGNPHSSYPQREGTLPIEVAWLGTTGRAVTIYAQEAITLPWATWSEAAGWQKQQPVAFDPPLDVVVSYAMTSVPSVGALAKPAVVLIVEDTPGRLWAKLYDGTTWTDMNDGTPLATGVPASEGRAFGIVTR